MIDHASLITQPDTTTFYITGGTLRGDAACYVVRRADQDLYENLCRGEFSYVLTSRQMGKSSLMIRTAARLRQMGVGVVVLDLTAVGQNLSAEQWYDGLLSRIGDQLQLEDELESFWLANPRLGPLQRWMSAIDEVVLPGFPGKLVIFIDEIDTVRSLHFSTDEFFAGIRELYNRRTEEPELERLTFCLLGVASPSDLIRDTRMTPFNIGQRIELHDFTLEEARPLAAGFNCDERTGSELIDRVLYWTGGHPYLTQRLCRAIAEDCEVKDRSCADRKCRELFFGRQAQEIDNNLIFVRERLLRSEMDLAGLLGLYHQVSRGKKIGDDETNQLISVLRLSGITRVVDGLLRVRNRIYQGVFDSNWVNEHMPDAELRRQRAAYRRGLIRAAGIAALIMVVISGLAFWSLLQRNIARAEAERADQHFRKASLSDEQARRALFEAERQRAYADEEHLLADEQRDQAVVMQRLAQEQRDLARNQREINRQQLYAAQMGLAGQAWRDRDLPRLKELVDNQIPKPGETDYRGFEWHFYNARANDKPQTITQLGQVMSLAFSPDGGRLVSVSDFTEGNVWDLKSGRSVIMLGGTGHFISGMMIVSVDYSSDGRWIVTGNTDGSKRLYDASTGREVYKINGQSGRNAVSFSPDGNRFAATGPRELKIFETVTGREILSVLGSDYFISSIRFSPDGRLVGGGCSDSKVRIWNSVSGLELHAFKGHDAPVSGVAFSPDGRTIASAGFDRSVRIWSLTTGGIEKSITGFREAVRTVAFSPDGRLLASGGRDRLLKLWDTESWGLVREIKHLSWIHTLAFSPDGKHLASGGQDCEIRIWDLAAPTFPVAVKGKPFTDSDGVKFSPDGRFIVSGGGDGIIHKRDPLTLQTVSTLAGHAEGVSDFVFSTDGRFLASGDVKGGVRLWDFASGQTLWAIQLEGMIMSLSFNPDGKTLAVSSHDSLVKFLDVASGRKTWSFDTGHKGFLLDALYSRDGRSIITASMDGTARIWEAANGKLIHIIDGTHGLRISLSSDGRILSLVYRREIKLWDMVTFKEIVKLVGHTEIILTSTFSPDGSRIASSGRDGQVKLWAKGMTEELTVINSFDQARIDSMRGWIYALAFSPDGKNLVVGYRDGTIELYQADGYPGRIASKSAR